jgi:hypothetical protein
MLILSLNSQIKYQIGSDIVSVLQYPHKIETNAPILSGLHIITITKSEIQRNLVLCTRTSLHIVLEAVITRTCRTQPNPNTETYPLTNIEKTLHSNAQPSPPSNSISEWANVACVPLLEAIHHIFATLSPHFVSESDSLLTNFPTPSDHILGA